MPTGPAPAFDCSTCGRRIGRKSGHYLLRDVTADRSVPCVKCLDPAVQLRARHPSRASPAS
jgi:hypothetical protein